MKIQLNEHAPDEGAAYDRPYDGIVNFR